MYQKIYFMPKSTGTFADALAAFGLATVLGGVVEQMSKHWSGESVKIRDMGPYYEVELPTELRADWIDKCNFFFVPNVKPISNRKKPVKEVKDVWDWDNEWEMVTQSAKTRETLRKSAQSALQFGGEQNPSLAEAKIKPEFEILKLVGNGPMQATQAYNRVVLQWFHTREYFSENLTAVLKICSTPHMDIATLEKEWAAGIRKKKPGKLIIRETSVQLFNPIQGQGQNESKANRLNTRKNLVSFWLLEFLKVVGLWTSAIPREEYIDKKRKTKTPSPRKTYVIVPARRGLTLGSHNRILRNFASSFSNSTAVKMDCTASLLYTQTFLNYSEEGQQDEIDFDGYGPENVMAGFQVAHYKSLNDRAYTMLGLSFIGLPDWTGEVKTRERVNELKDVIKEHFSIIGNIDEEHSDGYDLLVRYRDFLSGGDLETFFDFSVRYGHYLMSEWSKANLRVRPFTSNNLRRLIMAKEPKLEDIIKVKGFRNIAAAIRHSTVIPQRRKAKKEETAYEPEYNLGMELKRVAPFKDKFIVSLGAFIHRYMAETLRRMENPRQTEFRGKAMRPRVAEQDMDELLPLIDDFGPEVICNLLLAYGYAWEYRPENKTTSDSQDD
jgi:hypothetical protein